MKLKTTEIRSPAKTTFKGCTNTICICLTIQYHIMIAKTKCQHLLNVTLVNTHANKNLGQAKIVKKIPT